METKIYIILGLLLVTSGCMEQFNNSNEGEVPQRGLVLDDLSVTDSDLRPEQNAVVTASFTNYHRDLSMNHVRIGSQGALLETERRGCTPDPQDLENAREGVYPTMECRWTVTAPEASEMEGFQERSQSVMVSVSYNGTLENTRPLQPEFRPLEDIESTETISQSYDNGEISTTLTTESPVNLGSGNSLEVATENIGEGRLEGDYRYEYDPEALSQDCPSSEGSIRGDSVNFVCTIASDSEGLRNLFVSIHYKYIKEPILDITVVNRG